MSRPCSHYRPNLDTTPSSDGCEDCLRIGSRWLHLRICMTCGHIGCCDDSPKRHARAHFNSTAHPIIQSFEPGEGWWYCFVDDALFWVPDAPSFERPMTAARRSSEPTPATAASLPARTQGPTR